VVTASFGRYLRTDAMSDAINFDFEYTRFMKNLQEVADVAGPKLDRDTIMRTARFVARKLVDRTPQLTAFRRLAARIIREMYARRAGVAIGRSKSGKPNIRVSTRAINALMQGRGHPYAVSRMKWARDWQSLTKMGWAPGWRGAGNPGLPSVRKPSQMMEGSWVDQSRRLVAPFVSLINHVSYVERIDAKKDIVASALKAQNESMENWLHRNYSREFKRRSR
jgi:hypothetical protein